MGSPEMDAALAWAAPLAMVGDAFVAASQADRIEATGWHPRDTPGGRPGHALWFLLESVERLAQHRACQNRFAAGRVAPHAGRAMTSKETCR